MHGKKKEGYNLLSSFPCITLSPCGLCSGLCPGLCQACARLVPGAGLVKFPGLTQNRGTGTARGPNSGAFPCLFLLETQELAPIEERRQDRILVSSLVSSIGKRRNFILRAPTEERRQDRIPVPSLVFSIWKRRNIIPSLNVKPRQSSSGRYRPALCLPFVLARLMRRGFASHPRDCAEMCALWQLCMSDRAVRPLPNRSLSQKSNASFSRNRVDPSLLPKYHLQAHF